MASGWNLVRCTVALAAPTIRSGGIAQVALGPLGSRLLSSGVASPENVASSEPKPALKGTDQELLWNSLLAPDSHSAAPLRDPKPHLLDKYRAYDNMSRAEQMKVELESVREMFQRHEFDNGSSQVQVAMLTHKIANMTEHLKEHHKDNHSRRGLMGMLNQRAKLLKYMRKNEPDNYQMSIIRLGLKDRTYVGSRYPPNIALKSKNKR